MRRRDWLWENFPAMPGAIGSIEALRRQGHYLEILTSKPRWAEYSVWRWLGKWRPPVHRVTIVGSQDTKADFSEARMLVDDKPSNLVDWTQSHVDRVGLLYDRPHNRAFDAVLSSRILRVLNWQEVIAAVTAADEKGEA